MLVVLPLSQSLCASLINCEEARDDKGENDGRGKRLTKGR